MVKQLRRKFILINMLLVSLILLVVFVLQILSARQSIAAQTDAALQRTLEWSESGPDRWQVGPGLAELPEAAPEREQQLMVPTFCVICSARGVTVVDNNADIDQDALLLALDEALSSDGDSGELTGLELRYLRDDRGPEIRIAFADISWEGSALRQRVLSALLVLAAALAAFWLASIFLARWATRPTEESWRRQQQFVADASHELKTPLTVMLADADILLAHPEDTIGDHGKWVRYIREEAVRMKGLVEDLLFLARSDSAAPQIAPAAVAMSDLCWSCLLAFEPLAFERGAELAGDIADGVTLLGDEGQLRRLVNILLDNACKYCGADGRARLSLARQGDRVVLAVHNTGDPVPAEALPHLFERFYRADSSRDRASGGYGLGLAIAASIVDGHRGKIAVDSAPERGTCFTVTLPAGDKGSGKI